MSSLPAESKGMLSARVWVALAAGVLTAGIAGFLVTDRISGSNPEIEAQVLLRQQSVVNAEHVTASFDRLADPLLLLADIPDIHSLAGAIRNGGLDPATGGEEDEFREENTEIFSTAMASGRYEKLRFLDADGQEQVKVTLEDGVPIEASSAELKDESHEDYYQVPRDLLSRGEVYSSLPRLADADTAAEAGAGASLRISTGVYDDAGVFHGVIVGNVQVLQAFATLGIDRFGDGAVASVASDTYVIDGRGQYLFGPSGTELLGLDTGSNTSFLSDWGVDAFDAARDEGVTTAPGYVILASPSHFGGDNDWTVVTVIDESVLPTAGFSPILGAALLASLTLVVATILLLRRQLRATQDQEAIAKEFRLLDAAKTEFVALASHELRTPLTGVFGFASLLADTNELSEPHQQWAEHIRDESSRLAKIVEDLLSVSSIEAGAVERDIDRVDLFEVIDTVTARFAGASDRHEIVVERPAPPAPIIVMGDHERLIEVVSNLVDNAIKYSPDGGSVRIACTLKPTTAEVRVTDEGIGIAQADLDKLFQKFQRISRPDTETIRSTGLGLYMVKRLLSRMGGDISVTSSDGIGSTFTVSIPLALAEEQVAA